VTPGPFLLRDRPDVFWGVIGSFYVGNIMLLILNLPLVGVFAKIVQVAPKYLMPSVLILCVVGAYGDNNNLFDVWVMLGFGVVGYLMRKYEFEPSPLVVGLVLGPVAERSLRQALIISGGRVSGLYDSPLAAVILGVVFLAVMGPVVLSYVKRKISAKRLW
jgi:putative tricarboxylic transport membrane protein